MPIRRPGILIAPLATVLATLLTGAESAPTAQSRPELDSHQREPQHTDTTLALEDEIVNPCNGEAVFFSATIQEKITVVPSELVGGLHFELHDLFFGTGTGVFPGASNRVHGNIQTSFDSPNFEALTATFSDRAHIDFTASAPGASFRLITQLHLVDLPSGEERVTRQIESEECRG